MTDQPLTESQDRCSRGQWEMSALQARLFGELIMIARAGERCPTNAELARRADINGSASVADALARLASHRLVEVAHSGGVRVVSIAHTDLTTAMPERRQTVTRSQELNRLPFPPARTRAVPAWQPLTCQYFKSDGCPYRDEDKCGEPVLHGSSYCGEHHRRCFETPPATSARAKKKGASHAG